MGIYWIFYEFLWTCWTWNRLRNWNVWAASINIFSFRKKGAMHSHVCYPILAVSNRWVCLVCACLCEACEMSCPWAQWELQTFISMQFSIFFCAWLSWEKGNFWSRNVNIWIHVGIGLFIHKYLYWLPWLNYYANCPNTHLNFLGLYSGTHGKKFIYTHVGLGQKKKHKWSNSEGMICFLVLEIKIKKDAYNAYKNVVVIALYSDFNCSYGRKRVTKRWQACA